MWHTWICQYCTKNSAGKLLIKVTHQWLTVLCSPLLLQRQCLLEKNEKFFSENIFSPRRKMLQRRVLGSEKLWMQIWSGMLFRWKWSPKWEKRMEFWGDKVSKWSPKWEKQMEETKCQNIDQFRANTLMKTVWVSDPVIKGLLSPNNSWSSSTGHLEDSVDFGRPNEWRWRGIDDYAHSATHQDWIWQTKALPYLRGLSLRTQRPVWGPWPDNSFPRWCTFLCRSKIIFWLSVWNWCSYICLCLLWMFTCWLEIMICVNKVSRCN